MATQNNNNIPDTDFDDFMEMMEGQDDPIPQVPVDPVPEP